MNKQLCALCNIRKPKRNCRFHGDICDSCCGETRSEKCAGCGYYSPPMTLSSLPFYKCLLVSGAGLHSIFIAKDIPKQGLVVASFLVDTFGEGIKEVDIGKNKSKLDFDNLANRETGFGERAKEVGIDYVKKIIKLGATINGKEWHNTKEWNSCMELIGGLEDVQVNGEMRAELNRKMLSEEDNPEEVCPCCGEKLEKRPATREEIFEHFMGHKEDSEQYTSLGREFEKSNKKANARMLYERQIEIYQDDYGGYFNLGRYMLKRHDYLKAKPLLLTALDKLIKTEGENHAELKEWISSVVQKIEEMEKEAGTSGEKMQWKRRLKLVEGEN
ncbi:MAG: tetratricopeptide repeat protein [Nanoarchaeota archaeon]